jgi:Holliday junction resolvasome RuvABC DNA-binding subunit
MQNNNSNNNEVSNNAENENSYDEDGIDSQDDEGIDEDAVNLLRLTTSANGEEALSNLNEHQLTRLAQRAEEEAELNRAILMSLQYANATNSQETTSAPNDSHHREGTSATRSTNAHSSSSHQSSNNVDTLMAMGFTRDQSVQALRETRDNVELAANRLLGLDF